MFPPRGQHREHVSCWLFRLIRGILSLLFSNEGATPTLVSSALVIALEGTVGNHTRGFHRGPNLIRILESLCVFFLSTVQVLFEMHTLVISGILVDALTVQ